MHQEGTINKHSCQNSLLNFISNCNYPVRKRDHCGFSIGSRTTEEMGPKEAKFSWESYAGEKGSLKLWYQLQDGSPSRNQLVGPTRVKTMRVRDNGFDQTWPSDYAYCFLLRETWCVTKPFFLVSSSSVATLNKIPFSAFHNYLSV